MFSGVQVLWVPAPKEQVYELAITYPTFVRFFKSGSRIVKQSKKGMIVIVEANLLGIVPSKWIGRGSKEPTDTIRFTQTHGLFKGLKAIWSFSTKSTGTEISIQTTFSKPRLGIFIERILGKFVVEKTTQKILQEISYHLTQPS